jgi:hypothetical protein
MRFRIEPQDALPLSRSHLPHRHSGERRNPASCAETPKLDPDFRQGDEEEMRVRFPSPLVGEGGEMRFSIEPDEGCPLTLPSPTRGEGKTFFLTTFLV